MKPFTKFVSIGLIVLVTAASVSACGDSDDSPSPGTPANQAQPLKQSQSQSQNQRKKTGASNPASAGDKRPVAPDDKISDRPGGPRDKQKKKKRVPSSGGIPVSPVSP